MDEIVSMDEIEEERAIALPNKEVLSLIDINANVDLGLDLAAPVDLAAAANLNVTAPIEASAAANLISPFSNAVGVAEQQGIIEQNLTHTTAQATAPQDASVTQHAPGTDTTPGTPGTTSPTDPGTTSPTSGSSATGPTSGTSTTPDNIYALLGGTGSLLEANVNVHANLNLAAPIDGAVAANGNVAAPVDAAVSANLVSPYSGAEALAPQAEDIVQNMDGANADATATQSATVHQDITPAPATTPTTAAPDTASQSTSP